MTSFAAAYCANPRSIRHHCSSDTTEISELLRRGFESGITNPNKLIAQYARWLLDKPYVAHTLEGDEAVKLYRELAKDVRTKEGSEAAYYVIESTFGSGDMDKTEKEVFAFSEREPQAYWLAKAFILLGDVYVKKGDNFQARATWQSVADGYSPADDGIVDEAKARIAKLN